MLMMFCYSVCKHSDALDHCASLNTLDHIYNRGLPGLGSDRDVSNPEEIGGSREFRGLVYVCGGGGRDSRGDRGTGRRYGL